jgi:hypothetical protein
MRVLSLAAACLVVAACGEQPAGGPDPEAGQGGGGSAAEADPVDLIGSWTLAEVAGEGDSVIRLALNEVRVWRDCGILSGSWRADSYGQFVAYIAGYSESCGSADASTPEWLSRATSFAVDGDARLLLDAQGDVTARLLPGAEPTPGPNLAPSEAEPPVVTDELRRALAPAAPLPPELDPAGADALTGRWVPADGSTSSMDTPYVELAADSGWQGSDGCNGYNGRWIAGPDGALLAVSGGLTLVGCDNVPVGGWLAGASRAGLAGDVLVLLDAHGDELGRLRRA